MSHPVSSPDPTHHAENTGKLLYYNKPRCGARCAVLCGADEMNEVHQIQLACLLLLPVLSSVLLLVIIIFIYPGAFFRNPIFLLLLLLLLGESELEMSPYSSKYLMPPLEFENCPQRFRYINYILFIYYYYTVWLEMITLRN